MKKKILFGIAALMIAAAATFHVQNVTFSESDSYAIPMNKNLIHVQEAIVFVKSIEEV